MYAYILGAAAMSLAFARRSAPRAEPQFAIQCDNTGNLSAQITSCGVRAHLFTQTHGPSVYSTMASILQTTDQLHAVQLAKDCWARRVPRGQHTEAPA